jgi:hypothetical protein
MCSSRSARVSKTQGQGEYGHLNGILFHIVWTDFYVELSILRKPATYFVRLFDYGHCLEQIVSDENWTSIIVRAVRQLENLVYKFLAMKVFVYIR